MHDILAVAITVATIFIASFFSNQTVNSLRSELLGKLDAIQKDMREFYAEQGRHDIRIANLEQNEQRRK
jgi:hypothetical protein